MYLKDLPAEMDRFVQTVKNLLRAAPYSFTKRLICVREYRAPMSELRAIGESIETIVQLIYFVPIERQPQWTYVDTYHYIEFALRAQRGARMFFLMRDATFFVSHLAPQRITAQASAYSIYENSSDILNLNDCNTDEDVYRFLAAVERMLNETAKVHKRVEQINFPALAERLARWLHSTYPQSYPQGVEHDTHIFYGGVSFAEISAEYPEELQQVDVSLWYPYSFRVVLVFRPAGVLYNRSPYFVRMQVQLFVHQNNTYKVEIDFENDGLGISARQVVDTPLSARQLTIQLERAFKRFINNQLARRWNAIPKAMREVERRCGDIVEIHQAVGAALGQLHARFWQHFLRACGAIVTSCYSTMRAMHHDVVQRTLQGAPYAISYDTLTISLEANIAGYVHADAVLPFLDVDITVATNLQRRDVYVLLSCEVTLEYGERKLQMLKLYYGEDVVSAPTVRTGIDALELARHIATRVAHALTQHQQEINAIANEVARHIGEVSMDWG